MKAHPFNHPLLRSHSCGNWFKQWSAPALLGCLVMATAGSAQPVFVDLQSRFDTDTILEAGGTPLSGPLEANRERIDGQTLPANYVDNAPLATLSGTTSFQFAPLKKATSDAMAIDGQVLTVVPGRYSALDLALLTAPGSYADPFTALQFRYTDGSSGEQRFGPVAGWFASPTAFDHSYYSYMDSSSVNTLVSFSADWGDQEAQYILEERGNGNAGGVRFVDASGYVLYRLLLSADLPEATLGITVGNNFVISLATEYADPSVSFTEGYTEVANSMKLNDNFEHRALGNLKLYEFDLKPYLAKKTGELYILLTDATPENGWGPYLQTIRVYTGKNLIFGQTLVPALDANRAIVFAEFLTDGGTAEQTYLYDNSGSGPSNRKHRFADLNGSLTYKFDLPDTVTDAQLTVDMANNFVVALSGPINSTRYAQVAPGTANEKDFLVDEGNSILGGSFRFADASAYMIYQFDLPDAIATAVAQISVGNQFVLEVAGGTEGEFVKERDSVAETGEEIRDISNLKVYDIKLDTYLQNNPQKIIRIRLSDGQPADGWGPYLTGIAIVDRADTGQPTFQTVLNSMELFGTDVHNEMNKAYYTIDLSSVLNTNNPKKEVYVKFTDGSNSDGWGPGLFWMAAYSGTLEIQSDQPIFKGLKAMNGEPEGFGVNVMHRRYTVDSSKSLQEIVLPRQSTANNSKAYLLAATLIPTPTAAEVKLSARRGTNNTLVLAWPVSAAGYVPQSTTTLTSPWTDMTQTVTVEAGENVITVPIATGPHFYRLKK